MTTSVPNGLETLATRCASKRQKYAAALLCLLATAASLLLLPVVARPMPVMPGFVAVNQTALILVYALTTYLFFSQFVQARTVPILVLAAGSLFTTGMVGLQLLCFPNVLAPGLLLGTGPDTLTWLWIFWHLGPPLFALPFAIMEGDGRPLIVPQRRTVTVTAMIALVTTAAICGVAVLVTQHVASLPKSVEGDDFWLLTTSGIGPALEALTILSLAILCWTTKLRTVLQLWLAVSLCLLILDNAVTDLGAARATIGWGAGRILALLAATVVLAVYLREIDVLRHRAERIAAQREVARAIAQSAQDNLALALEASGMGDWELDLAPDTTRRTLRHDAIFGHPTLLPRWGRAEFLSHVVSDDRPAVQQAFDTAMRTGRLELECRIIRADNGAVRWLSILGKTYFDSHGNPVRMAGCVMDATERRQTEERLRQGERLEVVGQLTGGVAHDFNNLLTIISGSLELLVRNPSDPARVERFASGALAAARRGAELTGKLLAFSRRQVVRPEITNVNRLLQDFLPLLRQSAGSHVTVTLDLDPALETARIDRRHFEASLLNLLANARDAMPNGGRVTITTTCTELSGDAALVEGLRSGTYLRIAVADTGFGMDPATIRNAFEPFFTTKEVGKGAGLGLSQVYGFVRQAGGNIRIESGVGHGTSVLLLLPRAKGAIGAPPSEPATIPLRRASSGEVVLVVEDDPAVLELAVESLHDLGYRTLTADNAGTALDRLRGNERIDLLFSDVVMPGGMNGVQLAIVARTIRDGLKVVLTSGYTATALENDHELPAGTPLLSKPYAREELADTIRAMLSQS